MKYRAIHLAIVLSMTIAFSIQAQQDDFPVLKGPCLGQKPPGMTPEIYAPGIISKGYFEKSDVAPYVSPDGKYLFFCSFRPNPRPTGGKRLTLREIQEILDEPGNGRGDIYWISAKVIENLKPKKLT